MAQLLARSRSRPFPPEVLLQFTKGDRVFALSPDWSFRSKWGEQQQAIFAHWNLSRLRLTVSIDACCNHSTQAAMLSMLPSRAAYLPESLIAYPLSKQQHCLWCLLQQCRCSHVCVELVNCCAFALYVFHVAR